MLAEATWVTPRPRCRRGARGGRPGRGGRLPGVRPAGLRHGPAAPAAPPALCTDPVRGAAAGRRPRWPSSSAPACAAVNSALQRARATLGALPAEDRPAPLDDADAELLKRYVDAFERYDIERLVTLLHEDAVQSMPPFAMWVRGAGDIARFMVEPGPSGCRGSRLVPTSANGCPAFGQYRPDPAGGFAPWAFSGPGDLRRKDNRYGVVPGPVEPRAAIPPVRPAPPSRLLDRPVRAAPGAPGRTSVRVALPPSRDAARDRRATSSTVPTSGSPGPSSTRVARCIPSGPTTVTRHHGLAGHIHQVDGPWPAISSPVRRARPPPWPPRSWADHGSTDRR